jgi:N-acetylglucosamine-6-phosphate deacetylase
MPQIHHRNNSITLEGLTNDKIYCEIIADLIHTSKNTLKLFLKSKPLEKILLISDSLPSSHFKEKIIFCNKEIINGKDKEGTLAGSNNTIDEICKNLIKEKILTKDEIKICAFENQIKYLNLKNREIDILKQ